MDLNPIIDRAKARLGLRSDREYSAHLKKAHNYIALLREKPSVSATMLARIYEDAGEDPTRPVLVFMRDKEEGTARKIFDRAIKALSAASFVLALAFAFSIASAPTAHATAAQAAYTLCDNWMSPSEDLARRSGCSSCGFYGRPCGWAQPTPPLRSFAVWAGL